MFKRKLLGLLGPDPQDIRDYQLAEIQEPIELPESYCLKGKMTSIQKQNYGTCTSHMADGLKEFLDTQEYHKPIKLSQKFIYHNTKKISGLWNIQGDFVRNALKSVCQYGAPLEKTWPDIRRSSWEEYVKEVPSEIAYKEAEKYKGKTYWRVGKTLTDFCQAVYQQKAPVGFGMKWYKSYNRPAPDGRLPLPDKLAGGHAVVCIGWAKDKLWVRNSWGEKWGMGGYFYIPFDEFNKHDIWDAWCLTDLTSPPETYEGWCAIKYLRNVAGYKKGTKVKTIYRLRLRNKPSLNGVKLVTMKRGQEAEIVEDTLVNANGYNWQKIKVDINK